MSGRELIERLEKATGPDRELDAEIALLMAGPGAEWRPYTSQRRARVLWLFKADGDVACYGHKSVPRYTKSIDAALTLVPEGTAWEMDSWPQGQYRYHASVGGGAKMGLHATSPALALCIAALQSFVSRKLAHPEQGKD